MGSGILFSGVQDNFYVAGGFEFYGRGEEVPIDRLLGPNGLLVGFQGAIFPGGPKQDPQFVVFSCCKGGGEKGCRMGHLIAYIA